MTGQVGEGFRRGGGLVGGGCRGGCQSLMTALTGEIIYNLIVVSILKGLFHGVMK